MSEATTTGLIEAKPHLLPLETASPIVFIQIGKPNRESSKMGRKTMYRSTIDYTTGRHWNEKEVFVRFTTAEVNVPGGEMPPMYWVKLGAGGTFIGPFRSREAAAGFYLKKAE